jgi:DNA-binding MarR family transcriptional regulator
MEPQNFSLSSMDERSLKVLRKFRIVFNAVKTHFQQVEKRVGLGGAQIWALHLIYQSPGIGVKALAQAMDIHQTTASNLVKSLLADRFIQLEKGEKDRRAVQMYVLAAGQKILRHAPGPFEGVLPNALKKLDAQTLARLDHDLEKLLALMGADQRAAHIPLAQS